MTSLESQIQLITVPQEFTRLCNAVLIAEHGDDYLPIDDDQPDRGNDGYLKSARQIFAVHCFKRPQNQGVEHLIRSKMIGDLGKAIALKSEGVWARSRFPTEFPATLRSSAPFSTHVRRAGSSCSSRASCCRARKASR